MVKVLKTSDSGFEQELKSALRVISGSASDIRGTVESVIADVDVRGDEALIQYTNKFDNNSLTLDELKVSDKEIEEAYNSCGKEVISALELAALRIQSYHEGQASQIEDVEMADDNGVECGWKWTSIESVGIYVPGGKAAYPSSVLMNAIPAVVAGVENIVMVTPTPNGEMNPLVLAAAKVAGVTEIYKVGGSQAVSALAFGTNTVPNVDKIVGPGNAYVAEAKRQVFGVVGIDTIAGPSEILVISENNSNPEWVAADLLSQAEHDEVARSILVTDSEEFADEVQKSVDRQLAELGREEIARASWEDNGLVVITSSIDEAIEVANMVAPEHLELCVDSAENYVEKVKNAGAIFVGRYTPEAIGDYTAGPSHVLPTSGAARFSSGLSVFDFLKRSSIIKCSEEGFNALAEATELLANQEGLSAHAKSISVRRKN